MHKEIFPLLYVLYTILTNLLHSFKNSFWRVSPDITIPIFSPIVCSVSLTFLFQSVNSQYKKQFQSF